MYQDLSGAIGYHERLAFLKSHTTCENEITVYVFARVPNSEEKVTNPTSRTAEFSISEQSGFYTFI